MKVNKNIWVGKNKPYNKNSLHFPDGITAGGGSSWRYFDCKQLPTENKAEILAELHTMIIKEQSLSYNAITSSASISYIKDLSAIVAFGVDMSIEINVSGEFIPLSKLYETVVDMLAQAGVVEITEAEFYNLD